MTKLVKPGTRSAVLRQLLETCCPGGAVSQRIAQAAASVGQQSHWLFDLLLHAASASDEIVAMAPAVRATTAASTATAMAIRGSLLQLTRLSSQTITTTRIMVTAVGISLH